MNKRTERAARTGAAIGIGTGVGSLYSSRHGLQKHAAKHGIHQTITGGAAELATRAVVGYGIGAAGSAYRQHREKAHLHNFHSAIQNHTM